MKRQTVFSPCRTYRYVLRREWDVLDHSYVMFVGLNPSTADEVRDDPTVRRCLGYAKSWGYGALCLTNLFAFRATKPAVLKANPAPIGQENDRWLVEMARVLASWSRRGVFTGPICSAIRPSSISWETG